MNVLRYGYSDGDGICRWSGGVIARSLMVVVRIDISNLIVID